MSHEFNFTLTDDEDQAEVNSIEFNIDTSPCEGFKSEPRPLLIHVNVPSDNPENQEPTSLSTMFSLADACALRDFLIAVLPPAMTT